MLNEIKDLSWNHYLGATLIFVGAICPGFLTVFLFRPELISSLDTLKLLVLSLSLTLPVFIVNVALTGTTPAAMKLDNKIVEALIGLFFTACVFYTTIIISYFFGLGFKPFLIVMAIVQVIVGVVMLTHDK